MTPDTVFAVCVWVGFLTVVSLGLAVIALCWWWIYQAVIHERLFYQAYRLVLAAGAMIFWDMQQKETARKIAACKGHPLRIVERALLEYFERRENAVTEE